jgi:hypothetical protein
MDEHLATHDWFVGNSITLADVALFAYTHVAGEGALSLAISPRLGAGSIGSRRCRASSRCFKFKISAIFGRNFGQNPCPESIPRLWGKG